MLRCATPARPMSSSCSAPPAARTGRRICTEPPGASTLVQFASAWDQSFAPPGHADCERLLVGHVTAWVTAIRRRPQFFHSDCGKVPGHLPTGDIVELDARAGQVLCEMTRVRVPGMSSAFGARSSSHVRATCTAWRLAAPPSRQAPDRRAAGAAPHQASPVGRTARKRCSAPGIPRGPLAIADRPG